MELVEIKAASQWNWVQQLPPHRTVTRRSDEPRLEIGDKIPMEEGIVGAVLARYTPSGRQNEVCYVVELLPNDEEKATP